MQKKYNSPLKISDLGKNLVGPNKEKFTLNDKYVMLGCTPPDSYPPAVVEWYKGHTHNHGIKFINYVIIH